MPPGLLPEILYRIDPCYLYTDLLGWGNEGIVIAATGALKERLAIKIYLKSDPEKNVSFWGRRKEEGTSEFSKRLRDGLALQAQLAKK